MRIIKSKEVGYRILKRMPNSFRKLSIISFNHLRKKNLKNLKTPISLIVYVTNLCNANCRHCFYRSELNVPSEKLSLEQFKKISISLKHPLQTLILTGGEPFLRKDLVEICKLFLDFNKTKRITIDTNGLLTEKIISDVERILMLKPKNIHIQVSLDGPEELHDYMRGVKGCYKKAIKTLNRLEELQAKNKNLQLSVMTTICKSNYKQLLSFAKIIKKEHPGILHKFNVVRGSRTGTFKLPDFIRSNLDTEEEQVPIKKLESFFSELNIIIENNKNNMWKQVQKLKWESIIKILKFKKKIFRCLAGYTFGVIYQNGDVTVCEPVKPFANLKDFDYNLYKLWNSDSLKKMRNLIKNCFCTHPCNLVDSMAYDSKSLLCLFKI